jgi:hypothetical protein
VPRKNASCALLGRAILNKEPALRRGVDIFEHLLHE